MDSTDDDFGELYVDAKAQWSALVSGDVGIVNSCEESESADQNRVFEGEMKKFDVAAKDTSPCVDDACALNLTEANDESEYSDSDDDFNIVLREDDSKVLPVATNNGGSFQKRRTGNWCTMPNGGMVNGYMMMDTSVSNACTHTWSRATVDVNSDVFEKKPWRNPGMDINDFFNFGFNEQSWKDYWKPLGSAIEVRGGTLERIPSADLHRPRDSDPDVVIQIPVTNDVEELSNMTPVAARSLSVPSSGSRSAEFHADNGKDLNSSGDSMKEEVSAGCQDENTGISSGDQSPPKENCCSREVTPSDKEMIVEEKEDICYDAEETDRYSVERQSSDGEQVCYSPTPSCSVGKSGESENSETESSKGSDSDVQHEVISPPRRTRVTEHEATNIKSEERSGTKHSRHRRSHEDPSERHFRRMDYVVHKRSKHGTVKDASLSPDCGKKVRSLHRESSRDWRNGPHFTSEKDETDGKGFRHSNREKSLGRLYPSVDHDRHRNHRFGCHNNNEASRSRGFDHSKEYTSHSSFNLNQRKFLSSFKEDEDRYGRQHCERKYGHERSRVLPYESNNERNRCDWLREPHYQDRIPITDTDYRYRLEYSSAHERHNGKQSHENDLHCRRRGDYEYNFHRHRYEDGDHRAESGIPSELAYRETHSFAEVGRREFRGYERNEDFAEIDRRDHYTPDRHLDRFVSEKDGYNYRAQDRWPSPPPLSLRDSWYTKRSRGDSWRDDTRDFTPSGAYKAGPRDGWMQNLVRNDNVSIQDRLTYDDEWVHHGKRRFQSADDIRCSMREVTYSEHPSFTDEISARDIRMPTQKRMPTKQRSGYIMGSIRKTDERHHRPKKLRGNGHERQDPVDLTGRQGKRSNQSKRRFSNGGERIEQEEREKPGKVNCRSNEKATRQIRDMNDEEEGEIVEEAMNVKGMEERIQESLKKMEKRRERFKETEVARPVVATLETQTEPEAKTDYTNQQRPIKKRRWCAS